MDIKKWIPWNWFKKEEEGADRTVPVRREAANESNYGMPHPIDQLYQDFERFFGRARSLMDSPLGFGPLASPQTAGGLLKPTLDLGATDKEYVITVEIPGVDEKDVHLEIVNDTLTIKGEKKHEKEEKDKNYYRVERSYGSFQRVLSLPEDVDQDAVEAAFKKGVLTITLPRKALPKADTKKIEIQSA